MVEIVPSVAVTFVAPALFSFANPFLEEADGGDPGGEGERGGGAEVDRGAGAVDHRRQRRRWGWPSAPEKVMFFEPAYVVAVLP